MTRVLVFGTFDGVHPGHLDLFRQAKEYGDELVVVVARDSTVLAVKGRNSVRSEEERLAAVQACNVVDLAVLGEEGDKYAVIVRLAPDVICLGYDQQAFTTGLAEGLLQRGLTIRVVRAHAFHPEKYKSSKLRDSTL